MHKTTLPGALLGATFLTLAACGDSGTTPAPETSSAMVEPAAEAVAADVAKVTSAPAPAAASALAAVLAAQPEDVQARYAYRHPLETLKFFGIEQGMTVVEVLPGGGWYSKILMAYLGEEGTLVGVDYDVDLWPLFGSMSEEAVAAKASWPETWVETAQGWGVEDAAAVAAFQFGAVPESMQGQADAVLFVRALHNLARFEDQGGFLSAAIADSYAVLKPGGVVGVVQHSGPEEYSDAWASGNNGYLKESMVIGKFEAAGFELVGSSDINANPADQPTEQDFVWRLPPTLGTSRDNPEAAAEFEAIGESNRMTLKFRKPL
jgi:predicted methyltransferase